MLKKCPGFDIVLTLSEDEFPDKEKELPTEEDINFHLEIEEEGEEDEWK